jgi:hypothetical protein
MTIKSNGGVFGRNPTYNNTTVDGTLSVADKITHIGDEDTNIRFPEVNTFSVETNGAERLRVTDAGRLGIGTPTPNGVIHTRSVDPFNLPLRIENTTGGTTFDVKVGAGGTLLQTNGAQLISIAPNAVQSTQFLANGNVSLLTGNLVVISGKGIDFSATAGTGTSELFSDYEEGTWTPTFTAAWTATPTVTSAQYTKTGRQVTVTLLATGGIVTAGGGIGGLPFASNAAQGAGAYGGNSDTTESLQGTIGQAASSITNIPARILTGDTWQITATYFT